MIELLHKLEQFQDNPSTAPSKLCEDIVIAAGYRPVALADIGGEAFVFKVLDGTGETFALKVAIPREDSSQPVMLKKLFSFKSQRPENRTYQRFLEGIKLQRRLQRQAVADNAAIEIPAVHLVCDAPVPYFAMDWVESIPILRWLREKKSQRYAMDQYVALLDAVAWFHSYGVVHRDIKSENIMASLRGVAVLDWTLAKQIDSNRNLTVNATVGTHLSLKQATEGSKESTFADDILSLSVVLVEYFSRQPLEKWIRHDQLIALTAREKRELYENYRTSLSRCLPGPLRDVYRRASDPDEDRRYQIVDEFRTDVIDACAQIDFSKDYSDLHARAMTVVSSDITLDVAPQYPCDGCTQPKWACRWCQMVYDEIRKELR